MGPITAYPYLSLYAIRFLLLVVVVLKFDLGLFAFKSPANIIEEVVSSG